MSDKLAVSYSTRTHDSLMGLRNIPARKAEHAIREKHPTNCGGAWRNGCGFRRCPTCGENKSAAKWKEVAE